MFIPAKILALLLVPPGIFVTIAVFGFFVYIKWPKAGRTIFVLSMVLLFVLSLPLAGHSLIASLENKSKAIVPEKVLDSDNPAQVIVVLGGGRYADAPEFGIDTVSGITLERLHYAAWLHRHTGLPIMVSGGSPFEEKIPEARLMAQVLSRDFGVPVRWMETQSKNTFENAQNVKKILDLLDFDRVYLITHAWHMPRSEWSFKVSGIKVMPAPTGFSTLDNKFRNVFGYVPSAYGLNLSTLAIKESLGLHYYKYKYSGQN